MKKVIAFTIALGIIALCYCAASAATNDYIWSQKPSSGALVPRNLTPIAGRLIGFPTSINSPETIIVGSGLNLNTGTNTLTASGGAVSTLTDVTLTTLASGDFLKWSGTSWINRTAENARTDLGLGTLATQSATITDYLTTATAATTYQPLDADLTTLSSATAAGLALMDDASASAQRTTLGLGTIATQAASAVAITGGTLSGITSLAIANTGSLNASSAAYFTLPVTAIAASGRMSLVSIANGGSGYELHYGDKDGGDRTVMTLDYEQTPTNKTISGATNTITNLDASNLSSGTVATARLGSGTADSTTYLRGDGTWAAAGVSDGDKGDITVSGSGATWAIDALTAASAASTPAMKFTGAIYTGGTSTTTTPHVLVQPSSGVTPNTGWSINGTALGLVLPDASGGYFISMRRSNAQLFAVNYAARVTGAEVVTTGQSGIQCYTSYDSAAGDTGGAPRSMLIGDVATGIRMASGYRIGISSSAAGGGDAYSNNDVSFGRSAAGVFDVLGNATGAAIELTEMTEPSAPASNKARIFIEDNGAGKTRLMVRFPSGATQQIAIEP